MALKGNGLSDSFERTGVGFQDVLFNKQEIKLARSLDAYVMENVLFKVSYPAEFHAQTAAECAVILHPQVKCRIDEIDRVVIRTHESAIRIIDKKARFTIPLIVITASNTLQQSVCFLVILPRSIMKLKQRVIRE